MSITKNPQKGAYYSPRKSPLLKVLTTHTRKHPSAPISKRLKLLKLKAKGTYYHFRKQLTATYLLVTYIYILHIYVSLTVCPFLPSWKVENNPPEMTTPDAPREGLISRLQDGNKGIRTIGTSTVANLLHIRRRGY
jgi:hypothetical protein